jgi:hypothetical protein
MRSLLGQGGVAKGKVDPPGLRCDVRESGFARNVIAD